MNPEEIDEYVPPVNSRIDPVLLETDDIESAIFLVKQIKSNCEKLRPWPVITHTRRGDDTIFEVSIMSDKGTRPSKDEMIAYNEVTSQALEKLTMPD